MPLARRPRRASLSTIALVCVLAAALSGCVTEPSKPAESTAPPTATPIFANDEEALAAAEAAYAAYLAVDAQILADGGRDPERIKEVVTERYAERLLPEYSSLVENSLSIRGETVLDTASLIQQASGSVQIYGCQDISATVVLTSDGTDATPTGRETRLPLVLSFETIDGDLRIDWSDRWSGDDFC